MIREKEAKRREEAAMERGIEEGKKEMTERVINLLERQVISYQRAMGESLYNSSTDDDFRKLYRRYIDIPRRLKEILDWAMVIE